MNKNLKLFFVAIISFGLGVVATKVLSPDNFDVAITPRQKELQKIAIEAERRPFFPAMAPVGKPNDEILETSPLQKSEPAMDYLKLNDEIKKFHKLIDYEELKKFDKDTISDKVNLSRKEILQGHIRSILDSKRTWFKANFSSNEVGGAKFTFYLNYYSCEPGHYNKASGKLKVTLENSCYILWGYANLNNKWNYYSMSSNFNFFSSWKDETAYISLYMEGIGNLTKETNIIRAYVPIADEGGPISFLKYENSKFEWIEAGELEWIVTNEAEANKFGKAVSDHQIKHGEL